MELYKTAETSSTNYSLFGGSLHKIYRDQYSVTNQHKSDVNMCAGCDDPYQCDTKYCDRCDAYFCEHHIGTHLQYEICTECNQSTCIEMMYTEDLDLGEDIGRCFKCHVKMMLIDINKKSSNLGLSNPLKVHPSWLGKSSSL